MHRDRSSRGGTLARVPLAGGSPREIADDVVEADWSPDGANLAIIRGMAGKYRIEYPLGSVRYDTPHALRDIRVSPDGTVGVNETDGVSRDVEQVVSLMPAAHLFRLLNVSGATTSASAGGRASRSRGPRGVARATQPVAEEISSRSIQVAAVGVAIRHTFHCFFWSSAIKSRICF